MIVTTLGAQGSVCCYRRGGEIVVEEIAAPPSARWWIPPAPATPLSPVSLRLSGGKTVRECGELGSVLASFIIESRVAAPMPH